MHTPLQTCKLFLLITSERMVWSQMYRTSSLFLHPRPYPYQSAKDIETMLMHADKMVINWARSLFVCRRTVTDGLRSPVCVSLLLGRWLLAGMK